MIRFSVRPMLPLLALALTAPVGCARTAQGLDDDELALFAGKLDTAGSPEAACQELDALCTSTGAGCQAHELFCRVPTKAYVCQQLAATCISYPAACDVYNSYCDGPVHNTDVGPSNTDVGPKWADAGPTTNDGPQPLDAMTRD